MKTNFGNFILKVLLILLVAIFLCLAFVYASAGAQEPDWSDYWCNEVDGVEYVCIECAAFDTLQECGDYMKSHKPGELLPPMSDEDFFKYEVLGLSGKPPVFSGKVDAPKGLNVRRNPTTNFPPLYSLKDGDVVTVYEVSRNGNWGMIQPDREEWVWLEYIK